MRLFVFCLLIFLLIISCNTQSEVDESNNYSSVKQELIITDTLEKKLSDNNTNITTQIDIEKIYIIEYSKLDAIIITEVNSQEIITGPMEESTGDFSEVYAKITDTSLLSKLLEIFPLETYYKSDKIGEACNKVDFHIGLSIKKKNEAQQNLIFVNHYDPKLYQGIKQINKNLPDSLKINYYKYLTENCE